ncbi:MAG: peptidase, partial [Planctomycetota bacterium]|nr:peptidase [Planctomycetota bacterium]
AAGGIEVWSVLGLHTLDGSSGDFSLSAPHALVMNDRGPVGRRASTFSGNLYDALRDPETFTVRVPGETLPAVVLRARVQSRDDTD